MNVDVIIVGQGLCGTLLGAELERAGVSHVTIDDTHPWTGSRASSGILNPVMGRKKQPLAGLHYLLPTALQTYASLSDKAGHPLLRDITITEFHQSNDDAQSFIDATTSTPEFLHIPADGGERYNNYFHNHFGSGETEPAYLLDIPGLLAFWRAHLALSNTFLASEFNPEDLKVQDGSVSWWDVRAKRIIFCNGIRTLDIPQFGSLPLNANKGEALLVSVPGLPRDRIFKRGSALSLVPVGGADSTMWWAGASFDWKFTEPGPTSAFEKRTDVLLSQWLKIPYVIKAAVAGTRPTALDRAPIAGWHPGQPELGIFNGMGTKGVLQAPYVAMMLTQSFLTGEAIANEVSVNRFTRSLNRKI